ncbi:MAG: macro domain-containing protein [Clostridia bacterium]|nr:macro domain-containing protein [Clostridia bacterium]
MTQTQRRLALIHALIGEGSRLETHLIPGTEKQQEKLLFDLMTVRPAAPIPEDVLTLQDAWLQERLATLPVTDAGALETLRPGMALYRGDISLLQADAVVNAANGRMQGCFSPRHPCVDRAIHLGAGMQLRWRLDREMNGARDGRGGCRVTPGYNLPAKYVLHTVGPAPGRGKPPTDRYRAELISCYRSCLDAADALGLHTVGFCCISAGSFGFPAEEAAGIAIRTVGEHPAVQAGRIRAIFCVYGAKDEALYRQMLSA